MSAKETVTRAITDNLEALGNRIRILVPTVICNIGNIAAKDSFQIYASFARTSQSDTLDLCIALREMETGVIVSADLVKGGNGRILSEMHSIALPRQEEENELTGVLNEIREYIFSQEDEIVQDLGL